MKNLFLLLALTLPLAMFGASPSFQETTNVINAIATNTAVARNRGFGTNETFYESTNFLDRDNGGTNGFFTSPGTTFNDFIVSGASTDFRFRAPLTVRSIGAEDIMTWQDSSVAVQASMNVLGQLTINGLTLSIFAGDGLQMPHFNNSGQLSVVNNLTALQSIRVNAAGTGFEAFTPDSGGGSGTNTWYKDGDVTDAILLGNDGGSSFLLRTFSTGVGGTPTLTIDNVGNIDTTGNISLDGVFVLDSFSGGGLQLPYLFDGGNVSTVPSLAIGQSIRVDGAGTGFEAFTPMAGIGGNVNFSNFVNGVWGLGPDSGPTNYFFGALTTTGLTNQTQTIWLGNGPNKIGLSNGVNGGNIIGVQGEVTNAAVRNVVSTSGVFKNSSSQVISLLNNSDTGAYLHAGLGGDGNLLFAATTANTSGMGFFNSSSFMLKSTYGLTWSSDRPGFEGADLGLYRLGPSSSALGNGTAGSTSGSLSLSNLSSQRLNLSGGVTANSGGIKHARVTTGSIAGAATALVTVTWGTAFADANYTVSASVVEATTSSLSLTVVHVESVTANDVTVRVLNNAVGALTGTVHVIAVHD